MITLTKEQIEQLKKEIAEKEKHLELFIESANREIARQNGQIEALKALTEPAAEKEPESNGTGKKEKAKA